MSVSGVQTCEDIVMNEHLATIDLQDSSWRLDEYSSYIANITDTCIEDIFATHDRDDNDDDDYRLDFRFSDYFIDSIFVGKVFKDRDILKDSLSIYALKNDFQFKISRSSPKQLHLVCISSSCSWHLRSSKRKHDDVFVVRKYCRDHTCNVDERYGDKRQATQSVIAKIIKKAYLRKKREYTPGDIAFDMQFNYGADITYQKAWRAKEMAIEMIRGSPFASYSLLPSICHMVCHTNPGSVFVIKRNGPRFQYLFLALRASIQGWNHCRPVVVVDATFLKTCYNGTLISASTYDPAGKKFP